jgi:uncharacterized protein YjlB
MFQTSPAFLFVRDLLERTYNRLKQNAFWRVIESATYILVFMKSFNVLKGTSVLAVMSVLFHEDGSASTYSDPHSYFFEADDTIPNNRFPLLVYQDAFHKRGEEGATWLEKHFNSNNWSNSWRSNIYSFQHYHSNVHEVLGCYKGEALLLMGGAHGEKIAVQAGDILVIPAGVGHRCLEQSADFMVVGAYPNGASADLMKGEKGERPAADKRIAEVAIPDKDPLTGERDGLRTLWIP